MGVYYNRNVSLALDADHALLVVDAGVSKRGFLRLVFEVRCKVSQTQ